MTESRVNQIGALLEAKNSVVRAEAARAFGKFSLCDRTAVDVLYKYLTSNNWDARRTASEALSFMLEAVERADGQELKEETVSEELLTFDVDYVFTNNDTLAATDTIQLDTQEYTEEERREELNKFLELDEIKITGITAQDFLTENEFVPGNIEPSPVPSETNGKKVKSEVDTDGLLPSENGNTEESDRDPEKTAVLYLILRILPNMKNTDWNCRHGMALALNTIMASHSLLVPPKLMDKCILTLLEILVLDKFADYASGRSSVVPVRETVAQVLSNILRNIKSQSRRNLILERVKDLLLYEKHWPCQQSALLVLKYFFSIVRKFSEVEELFSLVSRTLTMHAEGGADEVVSSSVYALGSIVQNGMLDKRNELVESIMTNVWELYEKDNLLENSDNENLIVDLLRITSQWLDSNTTVKLTSEQTVLVTSLLDPLHQSRAAQIANLVHESIKRRYKEVEEERRAGAQTISETEYDLNQSNIYKILKDFYRIFMFIPKGAENDVIMSQMVHYVGYIGEMYRNKLQTCEDLARTLDKWIRCLELDHRSPRIDVIESNLETTAERKRYEAQKVLRRKVEEKRQNKKRKEHEEDNEDEGEDFRKAMCSEEVDSLSDSEKDEAYLDRKLLAAKLLAIPLQAFYETDFFILDNQTISESVQFLMINKVRNTYSMYELLGTAILLNSWSAHCKEYEIRRGITTVKPLSIQRIICEFIYQQPPRQFAEVQSAVEQLTQECNEFVRACTKAGVDQSSLPLNKEDTSTEDLARITYELAMSLDLRQKDRDDIMLKYELMAGVVEAAKLKIRANTARVFSFMSSALFTLQFCTDKMTPMIRPLVDCLQTEENINVTCEVYKYSIPMMVTMTCTRSPRPHVKILERALAAFTSCNIRIPKTADWEGKSDRIYLLYALTLGDQKYHYSSQNAELMLHLFLTTIDSSLVPEFYQLLQVNESKDTDKIIVAFELQNCFWQRYCPSLTDFALSKILELVKSANPALRFAGAKAVSTYVRSRAGTAMNVFYDPLVEMLGNLEDDNARRGAIEAVTLLVQNNLNRLVPLFAPLVFPRLADNDPQIRDCAGECFRKMVPLLSIEDSIRPIDDLDQKIEDERTKNRDFILVLSNPSSLPSVDKSQINGLISTIALRHYQIEGITWLRFLRHYGLNGILADDMGLGKTLQTLCAIALSRDQDVAPPMSLIVCPRTLVDHWVQEWQKFFPERGSAGKADSISTDGHELIVISYEDLKAGRYARQVWNYVVLDEGHVMRNPKSVIWKAANELRAHSRLILSGTPVQNTPADLWALLAWLMPGYLGDEKYFRQKYLKHVMKCRNPKATGDEIQKGQATLHQLHQVILPFALRRLKSEVLQDLPPKMLQDYECYLTEDQQELYNFVMERTTTKKEIEGDEEFLTPLQTFQCLRRLVDHPFLLREVLERIKAPSEILAKTDKDAPSGKLQGLGHILEECGIIPQQTLGAENEDNGVDVVPVIEIPHRALIFCQWKASLELVTYALENGSLGAKVSYLVLHGGVPPNQRQAVVDRFNSDHSIDVLVLTTNIGGVGLNLTGADIVIFVDHDFNPSKDVQAMDRAHRLGQTRKVHVYRLITKGTVEERIMGLQKFKQDTADIVIGADNRLQEMNTEQLMQTLSLEKQTNGTVAEPGRKRMKMTAAAGDPNEVWKLEELWDDSQYEEQFDVQKFMAAGR